MDNTLTHILLLLLQLFFIFIFILLWENISLLTFLRTYLLTYLVNPAAEQIMPNSAAGYLHRKTAELTLDNDSVSPFFPYVFFHVYTKQD